MVEEKIIICPECGQKLRIPPGVGGIVLVCPSCKCKIKSDFILSSTPGSTKAVSRKKKNIFLCIFELPGRLLDSFIHR